MPDNRTKQAAQFFASEFRANKPFDSIPSSIAPQSIDESYVVQGEYLSLISDLRGDFGGYKIAYTTATMQQRSGLKEPGFGRLFANEIYNSPVTLKASNYVHLGLECEVAVRLGADLPASGAPYSRESVSEAISEVMVGIEVIDGRASEDLEGIERIYTGLSANISGAGAVLGSPVTNWRDIDLAASYGVVKVNGEIVGEGYGSDVMGHPLEPLAWLANTLAERGASLSAGMVIITGSIVTPKWVKPGDVASISLEGLGESSFTVE